MARKQSDYLADLLSDKEPAPLKAQQRPKGQAQHPSPIQPAPEPHIMPERPHRASMSLLGRESSLARIATGEVKQVTQLQLDPARVRIWAGNARLQAGLSETTVRDLIDSILAEGGQKVPAIVRRVSDDPSFDYEVIAGTRRHFAISWLRANSYPAMRLLAQVADLDDEAAFRLADLENRARKDVSEIERARNYAAALGQHYGGKQVRMAERLKLSKGWLSKMIKAGSIPDGVLVAFPDLSQLTLNQAYTLASALDDAGRAKAIHASAKRIAAVNASHPPLPYSEIYGQLMAAGLASREAPHLYVAASPYGRSSLSVTAANRQGLTIRVHAASGSSDEELVAQFREALQHHLPRAAGA
jgi:ParB family transcriptional regulator, chromosome partitioning protein